MAALCRKMQLTVFKQITYKSYITAIFCQQKMLFRDWQMHFTVSHYITFKIHWPVFIQRCHFSSDGSSQRERYLRYVKHLSSQHDVVDRIDLMLHTVGTVQPKYIYHAIGDIRAKGTVTPPHADILLRVTGFPLYRVPPTQRTEFTYKLWAMFKEYNVKLSVVHFNTMILSFLENNHKFSPQDILEEMKSMNIQPNRATFERLIKSCCKEGDIFGAYDLLKQMNEHGVEVSGHIFNSLIEGYFKKGDARNARYVFTLMRGYLPLLKETWLNLLIGYASIGDIDSIHMILNKAEFDGTDVPSNYFLNIILSLAKGGHNQHIPQFLSKLKDGGYAHGIYDGRVMWMMAYEGYLDIAYQAFLMYTDLRYTTLGSYGHFFFEMMVVTEAPVDTATYIINDLKKRGYIRSGVSHLLFSAYKQRKIDYALEILKWMKEDQQEITKLHYFYPAICQYRNKQDLQGSVYKQDLQALKKILQLMVDEDVTQDEFIHALFCFIYPALSDLTLTQYKSVQRLLKNIGFDRYTINSGWFLYLMETSNDNFQQAISFATSHKVKASPNLLYNVKQMLRNPPHIHDKDNSIAKMTIFCAQYFDNPELLQFVCLWYLTYYYKDNVNKCKEFLDYCASSYKNFEVSEDTVSIMEMRNAPKELVDKLKGLQTKHLSDYIEFQNDLSSKYKDNKIEFQNDLGNLLKSIPTRR